PGRRPPCRALVRLAKDRVRAALKGATMILYPIFLKLEGKKVLIVGGGQIAEEKLFGVLRSATDVTVVAPQISEKIRGWANQGLLHHQAGEYRLGMVRDYFLVIAATDSQAVNQ